MGTMLNSMFLFAATALLLATPASADEIPDNLERLTPSTDWNIDFGEESCRLARVFGEGDDKHLLFIEQSGPSENFSLTLAGPRLKRFKQIITRLGLEKDEGFPQVYSDPAEVVGYGTAEVFASLEINDAKDDNGDELRTVPQIDLDEAATIDRVVFGHGGYALSFETGNMAPPLQALNVCAADFVRAWGLDAEKHQSLRKLAYWKNEGEVARRIQKKYTQSAVNRGEQANIRMRVIVEADGSVSDCKLYDATETDRLKSNACDEMARAEFEPAIDAAGNPMRSFHMTNIMYRIFGASSDGTRPRL